MLYFIVNPASSSGQGMKIWEKTRQLLKEKNIPYKSFMLRQKGETAKAAATISRLEEPATVIVLGGDGTINEFLTGLKERSHITFGVISTGSGNDFANALALPENPEEMLELILSGRGIRPLHTGVARTGDASHPFAVSSGIGLDAAVCEAAEVSGTKSLLNSIGLGKLVYTWHGLKALLKSPVMKVTLETENETIVYEKTYFIAAMNTKYEGGGYMFAPEATPEDEYLDLIVAQGIPRLKAITMMPKARRGEHVKMKGIHIIRCRKALIRADRPAFVHTDGEVLGCFDTIEYSLSEDRLATFTGEEFS